MNKIKNTIGWREWVILPELNHHKIKAKIDTGAKTSAIHAENIEVFTKRKKKFVRFDLYPHQNNKLDGTTIEAPLLEMRSIRSSIGTETKRPVIISTIEIGETSFEIELTLIDRNMMGFRMLLGRDAIKSRYLVNCEKSFVQSNELNRRIH